jgi:hypothetical protein
MAFRDSRVVEPGHPNQPGGVVKFVIPRWTSADERNTLVISGNDAGT